MKKIIVFIITLLVVLCSANPSYAATALEQLANSMQPGTWAELNTVGFNRALLEPCLDGSNILEYADSATWDPISKQLLFLGTTHGTCLQERFIIYSDADNTWRSGPLPADANSTWFVHAYDHNAIDPATGNFYYRHYLSRRVYKYSPVSATWSTLPEAPSSLLPSPQCCGALAYFPEMAGFIFVDGNAGVLFFNVTTNQWSKLGGPFPLGPYQQFAEYNPVHKVIIFGGGDTQNLYKVDASGIITQLRQTPVGLSVNRSLVTVDPLSGKYLVMIANTNQMYEYDVILDTWSSPVSLPMDLGGSSFTFYNAVTPVSNYGVIMLLRFDFDRSKVYLYKHSASTPVLNIPVNTWVKRNSPAYPNSVGGHNKHTKMTHDSESHAVYIIGGDYLGDGGQNSREMIYKYDAATDTWANVLNYIDSGTAGFPEGRCDPGWTYDFRRKVFWMGMGQNRQPSPRPGLLKGGLWTFDPKETAVSSKYHLEGPDVPNGYSAGSSKLPVNPVNDVFYMLYDNNTDSLYVPYNNGSGAYMAKYSLNGITIKNGVSKDNWSYTNLPVNFPYAGMNSFAVDSKRNKMVFYFPWPGAPVNVNRGETWEFIPPNTWVKLSDTVLPAKSQFGMVYDSVNDKIVIFGGGDSHEGGNVNMLNDTWGFDRDPASSNYHKWVKLAVSGQIPSPRKGESMAYDAYNNAIVVFGGTGWETYGQPDAYGYYGHEIFLLRLGSAAQGTKGDVNSDSAVDVLDVQSLVNHILGIQDYGVSADVNSDSSVDVLDVQEVVNIILGG